MPNSRQITTIQQFPSINNTISKSNYSILSNPPPIVNLHPQHPSPANSPQTKSPVNCAVLVIEYRHNIQSQSLVLVKELLLFKGQSTTTRLSPQMTIITLVITLVITIIINQQEGRSPPSHACP